MLHVAEKHSKVMYTLLLRYRVRCESYITTNEIIINSTTINYFIVVSVVVYYYGMKYFC